MKPNRIRTVFSVLVAIVLAFAASAPAFAAETSNGYQYTTDSLMKTAQITGYTGTAITLTIPSVIEGYTVTSLKSEAFKGKTALLSVTIPDTVTTIGSDCFYGCTLLGSLDLGKGVSSIGTGAFENCIALSTVKLPAATSSIGADAFRGCKALAKYEVNESNLVYKSVDGVLFNRLMTTLIAYPPARSGASYTVPDVSVIDDYAFSGSKSLSEVTLPASVITIGKGAFKDCPALTKVVLPQKLSKLEDELFSGCKKLSALSFPTTVKSIGAKTFADCVAIQALTIPDNVTTVGNEAFAGCTGVKTVTINKGLTAISGSAFSGCTGIKEFVASSDANYVAVKGILFSKDGTRLIAFPAGSTIGSFTIGSKVTTIGANAFDSCKTLKKLTIPATVKTLVEPCVKNCGDLVIYVEDGSAAKAYFQSHTTGFSTLKIGADKPGDVNEDGAVDNADVILLRRYVAKWKDVKIQTGAADVNKDNEIDNADVILIRRYVAGWKNVTLK